MVRRRVHRAVDGHASKREVLLMPFLKECPYPNKPSWDTVRSAEEIYQHYLWLREQEKRDEGKL